MCKRAFSSVLQEDMIESDAVKRDVVWQRVKENEKSLELELITEGGGGMRKKNTKKQQLTDKEDSKRYKLK